MDNKTYATNTLEETLTLTSKEILEIEGITEYGVEDIVADFQDSMTYKQEHARMFKILDAADRSEIWKVYNQKIPKHVQTPVNNPITIIKEATKASIMPTSYAGEFKPMSMKAKELAYRANKFFESKWNSIGMNKVNSEAASHAFLHGTAGVLFGWANDIVDYTDTTLYFNQANKSKIQAKSYHPSNIFPDPSANTVGEMRFIMFAEKKSKDFLKSIPKFTMAIKNIDDAHDTFGQTDPNYAKDKVRQDTSKVVTFITCYRRVVRKTIVPATGEEVYANEVDVIYLAGRNIIGVSKGIQPNTIPFIPLYDEPVPNNFWGTSKCAKVLSLVVTLNKLDSTEATAYFRHQNPAEFVNALAGLNVPDYQEHRNDPGKAFTVNCDPTLVSAYAKIPDMPKNLDTFRQYLITMIQQISGVDSAYLGKSYGSIQTTGGVQQAIDRATMRDSNRINEIDNFIKKELELITQFYILHGSKESIYVQKERTGSDVPGEEISFDPMELAFQPDIDIVVSNAAPRSNASYEEAAMKLMELQMKYLPAEKGYPDFITPEELINWLNIPKDQKFILLDRMNNQMVNMKLEEYSAVVTAIGTLTQGGMPAEQAILYVAEMMQKTALGQIPAAKPNAVSPPN